MDPSRRSADVVNVNAIIRFLNAFTEVRRNLPLYCREYNNYYIILILWSMNELLGVVSPSTDKVTNVVLK